jgi:geranylgeranyl diphosphate synthase type I
MEFERGRSVTVDEYLDMIELKTGALYAAAASTPATLLGHEAAAADLRAHGIDVGRAFQIKDDLLDLTTPTEKLGKQRGSDLVEGKQTLVTVHAREQGVDVDALVESDTVEGVSETEIDAAVERLREVGSIEYARDTAEEFVERGKARLDVLPDNEARDLLAAVADFLVEREY